jgi:hypothetical protein
VVSNFTLINAETDRDIQAIKNGDVIDLSTLPTSKLNIRANTIPSHVGSVVFHLNNWLTVRENHAPYAIGGDINGNYRAWSLPTGKHTLTATPYERKDAAGRKGTMHKVQFTVVDLLATYRIGTANHQYKSMIDAKVIKTSLSAMPNPFSGATAVSFSVLQTGYTIVQLYDQKGAMLENLYQAQAEAGVVYRLQLQSKELQSGVYMLRLTTSNEVQAYKLVLVR